MNSRERVLKTINHEEPDRIPVDLGACCWSIVDAPNMPNHNYLRLCEYLGIKDVKEPIWRDPLMNAVLNPDERLLQRLGVDFRYLFPGGRLEEIEPGDANGNGRITQGPFGWRFKNLGHYGDPDKYLWRDMNTVEDIENSPYWPDPDDPIYAQSTDFYPEGLRERAKYLHENTDYAVGIELYGFGVLADSMTMCFGMDKWMLNMKRNPKVYYAWINKCLNVTDKIVANILTAVGDYVDVVVMYNDFGTQVSLNVSHDDYCHFFKPYEARQVQRIKLYTKAKVIEHSCGSIWSIIKDRAEMGLDVQNPMQPLAANMNAEYLKYNFGDIMAFHGGIDIQRLLPFGTPETIRKEIKRLIRILGPGGGWIAAPSHNIEPETPPENIVAMYDALHEFGSYPIKDPIKLTSGAPGAS